jgi:Lhr-like helicase
MTNSPRSGSEPRALPAEPSRAYALYHPAIQRWIYHRGWDRLRDGQERAAELIIAGERDVIIASATASGKTEAALLPICSVLARQRELGADAGVAALYVSPLKALINDQYDRVADLAEPLDLQVQRWHGDAPASGKARVLRAPAGLLLITPESLEALFVRHADRVPRVFGGLRYVLVDELHSFLGTERGAQLQSLLHRVEAATRRRVPRVALSATLGDYAGAAEFLRGTTPGPRRAAPGRPPRSGSPRTGRRSRITCSRPCAAPTTSCSPTPARPSRSTPTCSPNAPREPGCRRAFSPTTAASPKRYGSTSRSGSRIRRPQ